MLTLTLTLPLMLGPAPMLQSTRAPVPYCDRVLVLVLVPVRAAERGCGQMRHRRRQQLQRLDLYAVDPAVGRRS